MKINTLTLLAGLALVACGGETDETTGTTGTTGTTSTPPDDDGDGISNTEEKKLGLDMNNADTDGDGISDGDEIAQGSDAANKFSWPDRAWPDNRPTAEADGLTFTGYGYDEVFPNLAGNDYFGNEFELWQLYGSIILIDFSAGWCPPCNDVASEAQAFWDERREEGFVIFHAMSDGWGYPSDADTTFITEWSDTFGLGFPVVGEGDVGTVYGGLRNAGFNPKGYIPFFILLDKDMTIDTEYIGGGQDAAIGARVDELMNK
jgi:hypothetical protein